MKNNRYSTDLKQKVVEEFLDGTPTKELMEKYNIKNKGVIYQWTKKYENNETLESQTGRAKGPNKGRPKAIKPFEEMTREELIEHCNMVEDIKKLLAEAE
jgi:transposase-like protein